MHLKYTNPSKPQKIDRSRERDPRKNIVFAVKKLHKLKGLIILEEEHIEALKSLLQSKGSNEGS